MTPRLDLIGFVVTDMARTLDFYRRLGLDIPTSADAEPHVEHVLPGGLRLAWDTTDVVLSFEPAWTPPSGGHRMPPAFLCDSPPTWTRHSRRSSPPVSRDTARRGTHSGVSATRLSSTRTGTLSTCSRTWQPDTPPPPPESGRGGTAIRGSAPVGEAVTVGSPDGH